MRIVISLPLAWVIEAFAPSLATAATAAPGMPPAGGAPNAPVLDDSFIALIVVILGVTVLIAVAARRSARPPILAFLLVTGGALVLALLAVVVVALGAFDAEPPADQQTLLDLAVVSIIAGGMGIGAASAWWLERRH